MTESGDTRKRGHWSLALSAVFWVGMGINALGDGRMWFGAAGVALGLMAGVTYWWPRSAFTRYMEAPILRRKRPAGR